MAVGRAQRRVERRPAFEEMFGTDGVDLALDLIEVLEFGWHDCYGDVTPPDDVVADILVCSEGRLDNMVSAVRLALADCRDLRVWADDRRSKSAKGD